MNAQDIITQLQLEPHPEGGHYRQTWAEPGDNRAQMTMIYFLLSAGESSHWHRVDASEFWLYHAGAPLILSMSATDDGPARDHVLTDDLTKGAPQIVVPKDHWQSARSTGDWTLVSCAVSPGFDFAGFTLAEPAFDIPKDS